MAKASAQAKSKLLANMSHELRTPLSAIDGLSHGYLRTPLDAQPRNEVFKLARATKSLVRIANNILDFSQIEARGAALELRPFSPTDAAEQLRAILGDVAPGSVFGLGDEGRGALLHQAVQRGVFRAVEHVVDRGTLRHLPGCETGSTNVRSGSDPGSPEPQLCCRPT